MTRGAHKEKRFLGHALTRTQVKTVVNLIALTTGPLGIHKRFFKTEETFWKAILIVTGMKPNPGEGFTLSVSRIRGTMLAKRSPARRAMIDSVDKRAFYEAIGVSLSETITAEAIEVIATAHARACVRNAEVPAVRLKAKRQKFHKAKVPTKQTKEEFYASWEWRTLRMEVIKQHGRACQCCGATPGMKYADGAAVRICVDHIKPISKYWHLRLDRTNLQILCDECNQGKGNWDETDFRPKYSPDQWIIDDNGVDPAILDQLSVHGEMLQ